MAFRPDYKNILDAARNKKPKRLPLYEHIISPEIMEKIIGSNFAKYECSNDDAELHTYFTNVCRFFKEMTYDTVSYEFSIISILPAAGAGIMGKEPGPIQCRRDFEAINWDGLVQKYIDNADKKFAMLGRCLPDGMKAIGGVANGVFEISEDLVGLEYLSYMQADDPKLFADVFCKIGDLMVAIWQWFLEKHAAHYCVCRFGDDLGFKSGLLTAPSVIREHIIPQYRRVIDLVHKHGYPFLWHSCGNIFEIMDDMKAIGIDAKHSNEDAIAPYDTWIRRYGDKIGLFGGIDVDLLCQCEPEEVYARVLEAGTRFRNSTAGYALGSGNSHPNYIPIEQYYAMVRAAQQIRQQEAIIELLC